jgi:hypothetical protein
VRPHTLRGLGHRPILLELFEHPFGPDADWLAELLDAGIVTPEEALGSRGFHQRIPIERMSQLLVPRGIEPARIAGLAFAGSWTGEESTRYQQFVDQFDSYAQADDPSVAAVGRAGVEIFTRARDEALEGERQRGSSEVHGAAGVMVGSFDQSGRPA